MTIDRVAIGSHVWARGGKLAGRITRFVVAPATHQLAALVVDHGPLSTERVVDVALVDRWDDGEVFLAMGDDEAGRLPLFATRQVARVREPASPERGVTFDPVAGFVRIPDEGAGIAELHGDPPFEMSSPETVVETISSVPSSSVVLSKHTAIVSADGFTAGHLHTLSLAEQNLVVGFEITAGILYKHYVRLPVSSVTKLSQDRVELTQGLDELTDSVDEADVRLA